MYDNNIILDKSSVYSLMINGLCNKLLDEKEYMISGELMKSARNMTQYVIDAVTDSGNKGEFIKKITFAAQEARDSKYFLRLLNKNRGVDADCSAYLNKIEEIIEMLYRVLKTSQYIDEWNQN